MYSLSSHLYPSIEEAREPCQNEDASTEVLAPLLSPDLPRHSLALQQFYPTRRRVPLDRAAAIGRDPSSSLQLDDVRASRFHAVIEPDSHGLFIRDRGSRNGTYVNGQRLGGAAVRVRKNSIIRIGASVATIVGCPASEHRPTDDFLVGESLAGVRRQLRLMGSLRIPLLISGPSGCGKTTATEFLSRNGGCPSMNIIDCSALRQEEVPMLFRSDLLSDTTTILENVELLSNTAKRAILAELRSARLQTPLIATTRLEREELLESGSFFSSLDRMLTPVNIRLPDLSRRPGDIPALCHHLLGRLGMHREVSPDAMEALTLHSWNGNVRELDCIVTRAALDTSGTIDISNLPVELAINWETKRSSLAESAQVECTASEVRQTLSRNRGNVCRTSKELGVARGQLYRLFKRFNIEPNAFRSQHGGQR